MAYSKDLKSVCPAPIKTHSGFEVISHPTIQPLREGFFCKVHAAVSGAAPKDFLRVYEYGRGRKKHLETWPAYIAKVGQKCYPNESITEHLIVRVGQLMNLNMAASRLMWVRGQLRFLSKYFLRPDESLIHGAEIFAGHLADKEFVALVEEEDMERDIFTFQVVEEAVRSRFPNQAKEIMQGFVKLLGFDAVVGNNDRHFFNWGVVTQIAGKRPPRFSPIFDSARGLLWNTDEDGLAKAEANLDQFMTKYVRDCHPKTGWDGVKSPNHFHIIRTIMENRLEYWETLSSLNMPDLPGKVERLLTEEFDTLFSSRRKKFIVSCISRRLEQYGKAITI